MLNVCKQAQLVDHKNVKHSFSLSLVRFRQEIISLKSFYVPMWVLLNSVSKVGRLRFSN